MKALLRAVGLEPVYIRKVLGPLEKLTMCVAIFCFSKIRRPEAKEKGETRRHEGMHIFALLFEWFNRLYAGVVWLDAVVMPRALSTVLLMKAEKTDIWPSGDIRDDRY
jgi:hypothetical protein